MKSSLQLFVCLSTFDFVNAHKLMRLPISHWNDIYNSVYKIIYSEGSLWRSRSKICPE